MIKEVENNTISFTHCRSQCSIKVSRLYLSFYLHADDDEDDDDDDDYDDDDDNDCKWLAPCPYPCPHLHIKALTRPGEAYIAPGICLPGHILHQQAYAYIAMLAYMPFLGAYTAVFMGTLGSAT